MQADIERLHELRAQGYCCAQVMICLGLEAQGKEDPDFVQAVAGLCGGVQAGLTCGALTGAACMLCMFDAKNGRTYMVPELVEWFQETYGCTACNDILRNDRTNIPMLCPGLMEATYQKAKEILEEYGFELFA